MAPIPTSALSPPLSTTAAPTHYTSPGPAPLSVGLAVGLVLCPIAFIFITLMFWRVSRRGEVFSRLPTVRLRREQAQQRRDYAKFVAAVSRGNIIPRSSLNIDGVPTPPPPPLYTLAPPLPVYTPRPTLPTMYDDGARSNAQPSAPW